MMQLSLILLCLIGLIPRIEVTAGEHCMSRAYNKCRYDVGGNPYGMMSGPLAQLPNEKTLTANCKKAQKFLGCVKEKANLCEIDAPDFSFQEFIDEEFCNENSTTRKIYVANVDCINDNIENISRCYNDAWEFAQSQFDTQDLSDEDHKKRFCLDKYAYTDVCALGIPGNKCSAEIYTVGTSLAARILQMLPGMCSAKELEDVSIMFKNEIAQWREKYISE